MKKLYVLMAAILFIAGVSPAVARANTDYNGYSNVQRGWGLSRNTEHKTPGGMTSRKELKKYNAYYVGNTSKKICYLTFDCGYENGNTSYILDTLKKYEVKAVFFVTEPYVRTQSKLVKRMKEEGHLVGNHTKNHPKLTTCSVSRIKQELKSVEKAMKECTGYKMDKIMRPPEGVYSDRVLKVLDDMGYKTLFWSQAWADWDENNQPSVEYVVNQFKTYYHNGIVPLMHVISSADRKALPKVIRFLKKTGFSFERFDNVYKENPKLKIKGKGFVYDGKRATKHIEIQSKSKGDMEISFYKGKTKLKKAPKNAGKYTIKVIQDATEKYRSVTKEKAFEIKKASPQMDIFASITKDGIFTRVNAGKDSITIPMEADYDFVIQCKNKIGIRKVMYFNHEGGKIEKPVCPGKYTLRVTISSTKNYKAVTREIEFAIVEQTDIISNEEGVR